MPPRAKKKTPSKAIHMHMAATNKILNPSSPKFTHNLKSSSLPDDILMCITSLSLAECFLSCSRISLLPVRERPPCRFEVSCNHTIGFCTDRSILKATKERLASLASVNRRLRVLLRPQLFRVLTISDGKARLHRPSPSDFSRYREEFDAKAKAAIACKAKIDGLRARPYLFPHVRVVLIDSLERWDLYVAADGRESRKRKKFVSSLQELYGSIQDLLSKMTDVRIVWSDKNDISPNLLHTRRRLGYSLALTKWSYYQADEPLDTPGVQNDGANGRDTQSACRSLTLSDFSHILVSHNGVVPQKQSLPSILTAVAGASFDQITHLSLFDTFADARMLVALNAISRLPANPNDYTPVFPALCSMHIHSIYVPAPGKHQYLVTQYSDFLRAHCAIEEFWLHHDMALHREGGTFRRIGRELFGDAFEPTFSPLDILLPNLLRFSGLLEIACALAQCPNPIPGAETARRKMTEFNLHLDGRSTSADQTTCLLRSLAESTSNRLIDLLFSLTIGHNWRPGSILEVDNFRLLLQICGSLPENVKSMSMVVQIPSIADQLLRFEQQAMESIMGKVKKTLFPRLKNLRSVEIVLCNVNKYTAMSEGPVRLITFDGLLTHQINMPHPVLAVGGSSSDQTPSSQVTYDASDRDLLRVRGHPCLERVKILTEGDWVWSDQHGWEYCL